MGVAGCRYSGRLTMSLSVVVPRHNEGKESVPMVTKNVQSFDPGLKYEVIHVEDGDLDCTLGRLLPLRACFKTPALMTFLKQLLKT